MITVTLGELMESQAAFRSLMGQAVPAATSYRLQRLARRIEVELESCEQARQEACRRHGTLSADGRRFEFPPEGREPFQQELEDLLATEIALPGEPLSLAQLGDRTVLSGAEMYCLTWLISEPAESPEGAPP